MTRAVIIGGSGHVGTYLVPRLVEAGFEVVNVSRGKREPYTPHAAWRDVRTVTLDREAEEKRGDFGPKIRALKPDIVHRHDLLHAGQREASRRGARRRGAALPPHRDDLGARAERRGADDRDGSRASRSASTASRRRRSRPICSTRRGGTAFRRPSSIPATSSGRDGIRSNPAGHFNPQVFTTLAQGEELALPNFGLETVHHVHADDVAQVFMKAIANWSASVGEAFHAVSPAAVTLRGYAEAMAAWFGKEPKLTFLPWPEWKAAQTSEEEATATWEHIARSPSSSIAKAERLLGYAPRYTSFEAVFEAVAWLITKGIVRTR